MHLTFDDEIFYLFFSNLQQNFRILKKIFIFESKFYYEHIFAVRNFSHIQWVRPMTNEVSVFQGV
jgi:hypothetical protein